MEVAVAAGHPATTAAGIEILAEGGSAADAAVAASLASCVAETVMTGLLGGAHAIYWDAVSQRARNLDCFVTMPGIGAGPRDADLVHLKVPFGEELVHYAIGPASCAVPGLPAGLAELWRAHGRLPWTRLVAPALRLAREGVDLPPAHASCLAMLAPVMTMDEGARIYSPGGALLEAGERLHQPGLAVALDALAVEGAESVYTGTIGGALVALSEERGGLLTQTDLETYTAEWTEPVHVGYLDGTVLTRGGLSGVPETVRVLPRLRDRSGTERVLMLVDAFGAAGADTIGDTTNVAVADEEGSVCVLTSSLGLGSGDFVPRLDLHLNSMLGEADLLRGPLAPGQRMESMMAPTLYVDPAGAVLAAGAAGGTRLRAALLSVVASVLDEGLDPQAAVDRPRFHAGRDTINAEPGVDEAALAELERRGLGVRRWPALHHYFGGVSVVSARGAAADPRRSGVATRLR
jgi:gamma-glutamyltranspeptidase / glutathione hydrolase